MNQNNTQRLALSVAMLTSFFGPFLISGVNIALPAIGVEFQLDAVSLSWNATLGLEKYPFQIGTVRQALQQQ